MYTETEEQLLARVKALRISKINHGKVCHIVELAYKSGHHDGWYEHVEVMRPNKACTGRFAAWWLALLSRLGLRQ